MGKPEAVVAKPVSGLMANPWGLLEGGSVWERMCSMRDSRWGYLDRRRVMWWTCGRRKARGSLLFVAGCCWVVVVVLAGFVVGSWDGGGWFSLWNLLQATEQLFVVVSMSEDTDRGMEVVTYYISGQRGHLYFPGCA